jgi:predicted transposase/invertase (TIGR01784 family)
MSLSHDQFFRRIFSHPEHVASLLRGILRAEELETLDLTSLRQVSGTLVTPQLRKQITDVVWQCNLSGCTESAYLCILLEHKAQDVPFPQPQLLKYIAGLWERQFASATRQIHPVLPILFHQGPTPLTTMHLRERLANIPSWLVPLTPFFEYRLADLPAILPEQLPDHFDDPELLFEMAAMKWVSEALDTAILVGTLERVPKSTMRELDAVLNYIGERDQLEPHDLDTMAELRPEPERKPFMSLKEHLYKIGHKEGLEQGIEQGIERGLAEGLHQAKLEDARKMKEHGIAVEVITEITGLTPEQIAAL